MLESDFQRQFKQTREEEGSLVLKMDPGYNLPPGFPDLLEIQPGGRVRFVEMKSKRGRVSPIQRFWHERLRGLGHEVLVLFAGGGSK